jgi:hypothetical protein
MLQHNKIFIVVSFLLTLTLCSQAADTLKVHRISKQKVNDKGQVQGYVTISQKFYTPNDTLFREINYDEQTGQISTYLFYFYTSGRLNTKECYNQHDSLLYIMKYDYNSSGKEVRMTKLIPGDGNFIVAGKTVNKFDGGGRLIRQKEYFGKQAGITRNYRYDKSGLLQEESSRFKPVAGDTLSSEVRVYTYQPDKSISEAVISGKDVRNNSFVFKDSYSYNKSGLLNSVKRMNSSGNQICEKIYQYTVNGSLSTYEERDANGKADLVLLYEYIKHFMNSGTQNSRYEGF